MEITFNPPKEIVTVPQLTKTVSSLTITRLVDFPQMKKVYAETIKIGRITLWEEEAYDAIGQWTDTDVMNRLNELYA